MLGSRAATESALCACLYECWGGCCKLIHSKTLLLVPAALAQEPVTPARIPSYHSHRSWMFLLLWEGISERTEDCHPIRKTQSLKSKLLAVQNISAGHLSTSYTKYRLITEDLFETTHMYWSVMCIVTNWNTSITSGDLQQSWLLQNH